MLFLPFVRRPPQIFSSNGFRVWYNLGMILTDALSAQPSIELKNGDNKVTLILKRKKQSPVGSEQICLIFWSDFEIVTFKKVLPAAGALFSKQNDSENGRIIKIFKNKNFKVSLFFCNWTEPNRCITTRERCV